jgi:hypothetical protein
VVVGHSLRIPGERFMWAARGLNNHQTLLVLVQRLQRRSPQPSGTWRSWRRTTPRWPPGKRPGVDVPVGHIVARHEATQEDLLGDAVCAEHRHAIVFAVGTSCDHVDHDCPSGFFQLPVLGLIRDPDILTHALDARPDAALILDGFDVRVTERLNARRLPPRTCIARGLPLCKILHNGRG